MRGDTMHPCQTFAAIAYRVVRISTRAERPFHIDAWVVLPDHLHCVLTLPRGDDDCSNRIKAIKRRFVRAVAPNERRSAVRVVRGDRGSGNTVSGSMPSAMKRTMHATRIMSITIRSNMAMFGLVRNGRNSTFHRCVWAGVYAADWGG